MRGVLIDPFKMEVGPIFDEFDKQLSNELVKHHLGTTFIRETRLDGVNVLLHDEFGLARENQSYWSLNGQPAIIAGKGLILARDPNLEFKSATVLVHVIKRLIQWRSPSEAKVLYAGYDKWEQMPESHIDRSGRVTDTIN